MIVVGSATGRGLLSADGVAVPDATNCSHSEFSIMQVDYGEINEKVRSSAFELEVKVKGKKGGPNQSNSEDNKGEL